jgi:hypothetical protein
LRVYHNPRLFLIFILMKGLLFVSSLILFSAAARTQPHSPVIFTENKGQITDTDGNPRYEILYYCDTKDARVYFFREGMSVVSSLVSGNKVSYFRYDALYQGLSEEATLKGETELDFISNYYLPHCPAGLLQVRSFSSIRYKNYFNTMDMVITGNADGSLSLEMVAAGAPVLRTAQASVSACLPWSTYYGGSGNEEGWGITADASGNSYTCGYTSGIDFPVSTGSFQDTLGGNYDAFVIKMDSCGNRVWATFIGSSGNDFGQKVCMNGNKMVACGYTAGSDLPVGPNAWQQASGGSYDAFLFALYPNGTRAWATYFGGSGGELGLSVTADNNENIFLGGSTSSTNMPVLNPFQPSNGGPLDAFVASFDSTGNVLRWSTYYGGSGSEDVHSMACDNAGNVVAVGGTFSNNLDVSVGAFQQSSNGGQDGYLIKFDGAGSRIFSTYFGGSGNEDVYGVCTDAQQNIYISGYTTSPDMPVTVGAYQPLANAGDEIYIARFDAAGSRDWCTYFGGSGNEDVYAMSTDHNGHLFVLSTTTSTDIPIIGTAPQSALAGGMDLFILKCSVAGQPLWSTYFGGSADEAGYDIFSSGSMELFITGFSNSLDYPVTFGAYQIANASPEDVIISKLDGTFDVGVGGNGPGGGGPSGIYPNPAKSRIILNYLLPQDELIRITLYNVCGEAVQELFYGNKNKGGQEHAFNLSALPDGIYLIKIEGASILMTKKFILQN